MASFGRSSRNQLDTCDPRIVEIMEEVVKHIDCSILEGRRDKCTQNELFRNGRSQLKWPDSKHNVLDPNELSKAVDVVPYFATVPHIRWNDREAFIFFAGFVRGVAAAKGYTLVWGGDWDSDLDMKEHSFWDAPHFQLVE